MNISTGHLNPSDLRGRVFSFHAMASSSACENTLRSLPFGRYCRASPLVFSLRPRCQGLCGSAKYTLMPVSFSVVKVGTKVKNIRLNDGIGAMQLKTEFVKKA